VRVPAGSFVMGAPADELARENVGADYAAWEQPQHTVRIDRPFALARTEVTRAQYQAFLDAAGHADRGGCHAEFGSERAEFQRNDAKSWRDPGFPQAADHPVVCVNWHDAVAYAAWLSAKTGHRYRLPTEAEWEYAARAGTTTARHWGDGRAETCRFANGTDAATAAHFGWSGADRVSPCADGFVFTAPVAAFAANAWGLHDMLGNAWEWTADCFHPSYVGAPADGSAWVEPDCPVKVFRGSGWLNSPIGLRSAARGRRPPDGRFNVGFRVARDLPPPP
jgi:formylglycine-generating enzyme required for sulfatase activity